MSHLTCRLLLHYLGKCNSDSSLTFSSISDEAVNVSNMSVNIHRRWLLSVVDCVCVNETSSQCHSSSSSSACHWQHYQWCWCCWCWWQGISSQCHCWQEIIIMWKRTTIIIIIRGQTAAAAAVDWERRQQSTELQACETVLNVTSAHTTLLCLGSHTLLWVQRVTVLNVTSAHTHCSEYSVWLCVTVLNVTSAHTTLLWVQCVTVCDCVERHLGSHHTALSTACDCVWLCWTSPRLTPHCSASAHTHCSEYSVWLCVTVLNVISAHTTLLWDRPLCVRLWKTDTHYETLLNKRCFYSLNVHLYVRACRSLCYLLPVNKRWNWICIQHVLHASADMKYDKIQWNNKYTQRRQLTDQFLLDNITHAAGPYS